MTGFSAEWLAAREPLDHSARSREVLSAVGHYFIDQPPLVVSDMGSGTGSTVRALQSYLEKDAHWHLFDNDQVLLNRIPDRIPRGTFSSSQVDLSVSLEPLFETEPDLLTTSAFLDLVSRPWLVGLVENTTKRRIPFYAALTYDGMASCQPEHHTDTAILDALNRHQMGDKGFGPSLGPQAGAEAIRLFSAAGYDVIRERSDWKADARHAKFQKLLFEGWHMAACEIAPDQKTQFDQWLADRLELLGSTGSQTSVGHIDFFAIPVEN